GLRAPVRSRSRGRGGGASLRAGPELHRGRVGPDLVSDAGGVGQSRPRKRRYRALGPAPRVPGHPQHPPARDGEPGGTLPPDRYGVARAPAARLSALGLVRRRLLRGMVTMHAAQRAGLGLVPLAVAALAAHAAVTAAAGQDARGTGGVPEHASAIE